MRHRLVIKPPIVLVWGEGGRFDRRASTGGYVCIMHIIQALGQLKQILTHVLLVT